MDALVYPVRFGVVLKYFGEFCIVLAMLTLVPIISSLAFGETLITLRYIGVLAVYLVIGLSLAKIRSPKQLQANEAMVVVVFGFLFACLATAFPIMGKDFTFIDAIFESIACITTTGLSTLPTVSGKSSSFLFQRAWMEWYGSLGFITLCLVLLMQPGLSSMALSGDTENNSLSGGAKAHAHLVVKTLCALTLIGIIGAWILGLNLFESIVFSLAAVATGGLSPHDSGVGGLGWSLQIWVSILCIAGSIPLTIYYRLKSRNRFLAIDILQMKTLLILIVILTLGIGICTYINTKMELNYILHNVPLLAIQTQTTAGFTVLPCNELDANSKLLMICSMLIGGAVGSTSGGIKILRFLVLCTMLKVALQRICMSKHAVIQPKFGGIRVKNENIISAFLLILMSITIIFSSWFVFILMGFPPLDSLFEIVGAISNTGFSVGITNSDLPGILKTVLCLDMILGRLEIVAFLIVLFPGTWFGKRKG